MDTFISDIDTLHHIQRGVLNQLTYVESAVYTDLLPDGMAGNAFNYHLNYLLKHNLVAKNDKLYILTPLGKIVVDVMSLSSTRFKLRPVTGVLLLVRHTESGKTLQYKSARQPLIGHIGLPFGKLAIGQTHLQTAERMIAKRGLQLDTIKNLQFAASFNLKYEQDGEMIAHRVGEFWVADYTGDLEVTETVNGRGIWQNTQSPEEVLLKSGENSLVASVTIA